MCGKDNDQYLKLHLLLCSLVPFVEKTGMCGHCSVEGMENSHSHMKQVNRVMTTIVKAEERVSKIVHRSQIFLLTEVQAIRHSLAHGKKRTGKRGRYSVETIKRHQEKSMNTQESGEISEEFDVESKEVSELLGINTSVG